MELQPEIQQYVQSLTEGLYDGYTLDLSRVCEKLSLRCYLADFGDDKLSGAIMKDENADTYSIYVNKNHHPNRRRFTIAHEVGHYISFKLGSYSKGELETNGSFEDYAVSFRQEGMHSSAETEANQIAAEMLMPADMVHELVNKGVTPEKIAEYFAVSESSLLIRLRTLGYRVVY